MSDAHCNGDIACAPHTKHRCGWIPTHSNIQWFIHMRRIDIYELPLRLCSTKLWKIIISDDVSNERQTTVHLRLDSRLVNEQPVKMRINDWRAPFTLLGVPVDFVDDNFMLNLLILWSNRAIFIYVCIQSHVHPFPSNWSFLIYVNFCSKRRQLRCAQWIFPVCLRMPHAMHEKWLIRINIQLVRAAKKRKVSKKK